MSHLSGNGEQNVHPALLQVSFLFKKYIKKGVMEQKANHIVFTVSHPSGKKLEKERPEQKDKGEAGTEQKGHRFRPFGVPSVHFSFLLNKKDTKHTEYDSSVQFVRKNLFFRRQIICSIAQEDGGRKKVILISFFFPFYLFRNRLFDKGGSRKPRFFNIIS